MFLLLHLQGLDVDIMENFIVKEVEAASLNMTAVHVQALSSPCLGSGQHGLYNLLGL